MSSSSSLTMSPADCNNGDQKNFMYESHGKKEGSKVGKKRCRASRVAPTIVVATDVSSFRAKVQKFTGMESLSNDNSTEVSTNPKTPVPLKPMPKRPIDQIFLGSSSGFDNFNTTSFCNPTSLGYPSVGPSMSFTSFPFQSFLQQQQPPQPPPNSGLFSLHPFFNTITANMNST